MNKNAFTYEDTLNIIKMVVIAIVGFMIIMGVFSFFS